MNGSNATPFAARYSARPSRAKTRDGRQGDTAVGEPVSDVDDVVDTGDVGPLARLTADRARLLVPEANPPAVGPRLEPVRDDVQLDAFALEHRLDQLVEAARDDERVMRARELGEAVAQARVLDEPGDDLLDRCPHRPELARDHLVQRELPAELRLVRLVDRLVAELEQHEVQARRPP